MYKLV